MGVSRQNFFDVYRVMFTAVKYNNFLPSFLMHRCMRYLSIDNTASLVARRRKWCAVRCEAVDVSDVMDPLGEGLSESRVA